MIRIVRVLVTTSLLVMPMAGGCSRTDADADSLEKRAKLNEGDMVTVIGVVKGDEVRVQSEGRSARLRLVGIYSMDDATAATDPTAAEGLAASILKAEVVGHLATLHLSTPPEDTHGRYLGFLDAGNRDLSLSLLEAGRVIVYTEFPFDRESLYLKSESDARTAKRGLWRRSDLFTTVKGLRTEWNRERIRRGEQPADDPLLPGE